MEKESIYKAIDEWNIIKADLHQKFSRRENSNVVLLMKKGIELLAEIISWTNEQPAKLQLQEINHLEVKPVNLQERLDYILSYPNKYHSYVQLVELFTETEKLFNKALVMRKRS